MRVHTILDVIEKTKAVDLGPDWIREILIIDNYSTDGTRELLQSIEDPEISIHYHDRNLRQGHVRSHRHSKHDRRIYVDPRR